MKKLLPIFIIGILIFSGLGAVGFTNISTNTQKNNMIDEKSEYIALTFSPLKIEKFNKDYTEINLEGISTYLSSPGKPVLPKVVKTLELPFTACNIKIEVIVNKFQELKIDQEIRPGSPHIPLIATEEALPIVTVKNDKIYSSEDLFPLTWYDKDISVGLNENNERVTNVAIHLYPVRYSPKLNKISVAESADIKITYDLSDNNPFQAEDKYDMVVIAPRRFSIALNKLIRHKNSHSIETRLKTTESIYREYKDKGVDKPEQIKYFIKDAIEKNNITYVLLVGGLKSQIYANPCEHLNYGARGWYVPVRYHNFYDNPEHPLSFEKIYDPGVISDLYYADVYKYNESSGQNEFENWDSNDDGIMGAWNFLPDESVENDTLDLYPDVIVGRLACRNIIEVRSVVNKIINYEKKTYGSSWFKKMVVISGDGFMDQEDLDFQWDTTNLSEGKYTIYAQSRVGDGPSGVPDVIEVTIDRDVNTSLTFNHDDNTRINGYPTLPIAEIVSVSTGDILGKTNYFENISENYAYGNSQNGWANLNFSDGVLHIRGKTYDPKAYGNVTNIRVWVLNEDEEIVFDETRYDCEMYYEGEWVTGSKVLKGGGGALYYMPEEFKQEVIWASNGKLTGPDDILNSLREGCGFAFLSGHGSPNVWTDHFPGIPGNRRSGSIPALSSISYWPIGLPVFPVYPMNKIKNWNKLPVVLIGGCHNSQFNVSMIPTFLDGNGKKYTWCHGTPTPECFSWVLVQMPRQGAIATIGNTGLGYGVPGKDCLVEGLDGGICIEFFKQYGIDYNNKGSAILGNVYTDTLRAYHNQFDMDFLDHAKSLTQWVLLGDPSLMIGGYP
ncbi:hypothetical protein AYK20_04095 [Thermoplasmatales archaeon SG8-52-1]|nr:MAG: hypothetical protein AYK20_04095 [Thermoplasmatales archaeon SG8-52-1]